MTRKIALGYMPLVDAALLLIAADQGFDLDQGLRFELTRETSWANVRDKLALGIFDAAHMLAPMAIASTLRLGNSGAPMVAPIALGLDGNAISVSLALHDTLMQALDGDPADPLRTAQALRRVVEQRIARGAPPLRFAHVFPYSMHHYQLLLWLRAGGVNLTGVRLTVVPPPQMKDSVTSGYIDGFCVGEPWNTHAQRAGDARILHPCRALVRDCPEKVLAFRADMATTEPEVLRAASQAVEAAAIWASAPENAVAAAKIVASALADCAAPGDVETVLGDGAGGNGAWLRIDPPATALDERQALWLYAHMVAAGQTAYAPDLARRAAGAFRPDLGGLAAPPPLPEIVNGPSFDPARATQFIAELADPPAAGAPSG